MSLSLASSIAIDSRRALRGGVKAGGGLG
jgi:hypothetical protein